MPTSKAADTHKFIKPYLVVSGKTFRLKDHDPRDTHHLHWRRQTGGQEIGRGRCEDAGRTSGDPLRAIQLGAAADFSGHGCREKMARSNMGCLV